MQPHKTIATTALLGLLVACSVESESKRTKDQPIASAASSESELGLTDDQLFYNNCSSQNGTAAEGYNCICKIPKATFHGTIRIGDYRTESCNSAMAKANIKKLPTTTVKPDCACQFRIFESIYSDVHVPLYKDSSCSNLLTYHLKYPSNPASGSTTANRCVATYEFSSLNEQRVTTGSVTYYRAPGNPSGFGGPGPCLVFNGNVKIYNCHIEQ